MTPETKKKIEEAVLKVSPANRGIFSYGVHSGYSLAMECKGCKCCTIHNEEVVSKDEQIAGLKIKYDKIYDLKQSDDLWFTHKIRHLESALNVAEDALELVGKNIRNDFHERVCGQSRGCHCSINGAEQALQTIRSIRGEDKG